MCRPLGLSGVASAAAALATVLLVSFEFASAAEVIILDGDNFNDTLAANPNGLFFVKFYAPWCGHCKEMAPAWATLAANPAGETAADLIIANVDCTTKGGKVLMDRFDIRGYPTMLLFTEGGSKIYKHNGQRSLRALTDFARGGWRDQAEHDPANQPPSRQKKSFLGGYAPTILICMLGLSTTVGICVQICGPKPSPEYLAARKAERAKAKARKSGRPYTATAAVTKTAQPADVSESNICGNAAAPAASGIGGQEEKGNEEATLRQRRGKDDE